MLKLKEVMFSRKVKLQASLSIMHVGTDKNLGGFHLALDTDMRCIHLYRDAHPASGRQKIDKLIPMERVEWIQPAEKEEKPAVVK
jgi:hypothetical protein